jgi:hypothetical protein
MSINERYMQEPNFCPFCEATRSITASNPDNADMHTVYQPVACSSCDAEWHDLYTLTGYELVVAAKTGVERGQELLDRDFLPGYGGAGA